jgi:hypothetical protein
MKKVRGRETRPCRCSFATLPFASFSSIILQHRQRPGWHCSNGLKRD